MKSVETDSQVRFRGASRVRGNLSATAFAEVLSELHRWRATGALLLSSGPVKKLVYLQEGAPFFARSNLLAETLGQILVREKLITLQECEASLEKCQRSKRMQGTVLIEMGCISPANLSYALQLQLEQKLFDIFTWTEGDYRFNPHAQMPAAQIALEMTPAHVLLEGIRRSCEDDGIRAALGDVDQASVQLTDNPMDRFQDMGLETQEARFYALIDGRRTTAELLTQGALQGLSPEDGRRILYALRCANMIHFGSPRREPEAGPGLSQPARVPTPLPPVQEVPERGLAEPELLARQQLDRLAARAQDLLRGTLFEVLGVTRDASELEIRNAFAGLAGESHPDRLGPDASREARAFAEDIFQQLALAHDTLIERGRRVEYELQLAAGVQRPPGDAVARILSAEQQFRDGEAKLALRNYTAARTAFEEAARLYPEEAEFHACLGWAIWLEQGSLEQALGPLDRALVLDPRMDRAYVFRGRIARTQGRARDAEGEFEKALLCNPGCTEALQELRLARKQ